MRKLVTAVAAVLIAAFGTMTNAQATPPPTDPKLVQRVADNESLGQGNVTLDHGHVDLGARLIDGQWKLMIRDDTGKSPTWRNVDDVVVQLGDRARQKVPDNDQFSFLPLGKEVYAIGQTEIPGVVWLGWNTQSPEVVQALGVGAKLTFLGHSGPGDFALFIQAGNFGKAQPLWLSAKAGPQEIFVEPNTHTHANWVFTKPGVHLVNVELSAQLADGRQVSALSTLCFAVGAETSAESARTAVWVGAGSADAGTSGSNIWLWIAGGLSALAMGITLIYWRYRRASRSALRTSVNVAPAEGGLDAERD